MRFTFVTFIRGVRVFLRVLCGDGLACDCVDVEGVGFSVFEVVMSGAGDHGCVVGAEFEGGMCEVEAVFPGFAFHAGLQRRVCGYSACDGEGADAGLLCCGDGVDCEHVYYGGLEAGGDVFDALFAGVLLVVADDGGFDAAEAEVEGIAEAGAGEADGFGVAFFGEAVDYGAAGVAEADGAGGFVECFACRVVAGSAEGLVGSVGVGADEVGVAAGDD